VKTCFSGLTTTQAVNLLGRVDERLPGKVMRIATSEPTGVTRLRGCRDRVAQPVVKRDFKHFQVDCGFGKPQTLWRSTEAVFEIRQVPADLRFFVLAVRRRHNHLVVNLCYPDTVSGEQPVTFTVGGH